jgi:hypothetical protein
MFLWGSFDFDRLQNQLSFLYSSPDLKGLNAYEIIGKCSEQGLNEVLSELIKLAKLIVTIPASSASAERSFSGLKRIHTYLRNSQGQARLSNLSLIALEKELATNIRKSKSFYDDVLKEFLKKDRRTDLVYK